MICDHIMTVIKVTLTNTYNYKMYILLKVWAILCFSNLLKQINFNLEKKSRVKIVLYEIHNLILLKLLVQTKSIQNGVV